MKFSGFHSLFLEKIYFWKNKREGGQIDSPLIPSPPPHPRSRFRVNYNMLVDVMIHVTKFLTGNLWMCNCINYYLHDTNVPINPKSIVILTQTQACYQNAFQKKSASWCLILLSQKYALLKSIAILITEDVFNKTTRMNYCS